MGDLIPNPKKGPSLLDNFMDSFFETSWKDLGRHAINDVIKPSARNFLFDFIVDLARYKIFGGKGAPSSRYGGNGRDGSFVDYNGASRRNRNDPPWSSAPELPENEAWFRNREDAKRCMDEFVGTIREYGQISLREFARMARKNTNYNLDNYGWESANANEKRGIDPDKPFAYCRIVSCDDGWKLIVPKPILITANE